MSLEEALAGIWERGKPAMRARLAAVERAVDDPAARPEGLRAAHQMAGSLGTFGIAGGSETASELEEELKGDPDPARLRLLVDRLSAIVAPRL